MNLDTNRPKGWRKGQTIFNFLSWLHLEKKYTLELGVAEGRMADPFHIGDHLLDGLYKEFVAKHRNPS